jgi:hypothetical protein
MASIVLACRNQQSYVDNSLLEPSDLQLLTSIFVSNMIRAKKPLKYNGVNINDFNERIVSALKSDLLVRI